MTKKELLEENKILKRIIVYRCLMEGCRYGIEGVDKEPLDRCIYCGNERKSYVAKTSLVDILNNDGGKVVPLESEDSDDHK